jgi:cell division septum initiation protein DivIVA
MGAAGVFLKRAVRKAIGWYSRPVHEFDRATIAALQQVRQDMLGLQQQIVALRQEIANGTPAAAQLAQPAGESVHVQSSSSEQDELLLLTIELFKNQVAMQALRQALREENPQLLQRLEVLLNKVEGESGELKAALLTRLMQGAD